MADKQNCSENCKIVSSAARRRASLPTLSRILKNQTSSFQRRASTITKKKSSGGGFKLFLVKTLVGFSAVYLSAYLGIWGEPEESGKVMTKLKDAITNLGNQNSEGVTNDLVERFNQSTNYLKGQLEAIPEELKAYYDKSEKCIKDLFKGKSG